MEAQVQTDLLDLVSDLMPVILPLLGYKDLCRLAVASRNLQAMADDPGLWRDLVAAEEKIFAVQLTLVNENRWKEIYRVKRRLETMEAWLLLPGEGEALLLPSGQYGGLSINPTTPMLAIIGIENRRKAPVMLCGSPPHNLCELTGLGLVLRNATLRFPEVPAPTGHMRAWPAAIYVANGRLDMENCVIEGGARQWGVALQHKASVVMKGCAFRGLTDSPLAMWEGCSAEVQDSEFTNVGQIQVRRATASFKSCTMLLKDAYEAKLCYVSAGSQVRFEDCKLTGRGNRCSGISSWGAVDVIRCTIDGFYFALTKREEHDVNASHTKFGAHPRGGNAFLSSGKGPVKFENCDFTGPFTSAIEVEENTQVALDACRFSKAQCGVGLHGLASQAILSGCVFRECDTAIKVGLGAKASPTGCSFVRCAKGMHLSGDVAQLRGEEPRLCSANTFEVCKEAVYLEAMEASVEAEDGVASEVKQSIAKGICTFLVTGPHYRKQVVWRCNTCRLNNSRGVCVVCKDKCHAGHELEPTPETVRFFCDCGAERFCDTLRKSAPLSSNDG